MNKFILLCCLLLNALTWSQEINVEVIYAFGTDNKLITKSDEFKMFKGIEFMLVCTATKSRFELIEKMDSDATKSNRRFVSLASARGVFYRNSKTKENIRLKKFKNKDFTISKPYKERYQWKLTKETKIIGGYLCYKAIHTDSGEFEGQKFSVKTIAYYTPEIPLPFGPINMNELPGLVLEAQSKGYYYIAKNIVVSKNKNKKIERPSVGEEVTYKEFMDYVRKSVPVGEKERILQKLREKIKEEKKKN